MTVRMIQTRRALLHRSLLALLMVLLCAYMARSAFAGEAVIDSCRKAAGFDERGNWSAVYKVSDQAVSVCKRALQKHPDSAEVKAYLGRSYYLVHNEKESFALIEASAAQGSVIGMGLMGVVYEFGYGVEEDDFKAASWYRKAAEKGLAVAQNNLGLAYESGRGVPVDLVQADAWLKKAAEQGQAEAQFLLAEQYVRCAGVPCNDSEAGKWFAKAAAQGYAPARDPLNEVRTREAAFAKALHDAEQPDARSGDYVDLGVMYSVGYGTAQDYLQAINWFLEGARSSDPGALGELRNIARKLETLEQISKGARYGDEEAGSVVRRYAMPVMLPGTKFRDCPYCPQMTMISAGTQRLDYTDQSGVHHESDMKLSDGFGFGKLEINRRQWQAITGTPAPASGDNCTSDDCPVTALSLKDAQQFIVSLNQKTGQQYDLADEIACDYVCHTVGNKQYCGNDTPQTAQLLGDKPPAACAGIGIRLIRMTDSFE